jgi:hypothetical protein
MALTALTVCMTVLMNSCEKDVIGQTPTDKTAPGKVTNVQAMSIPGGARITYDLPTDPDLLYVKAVWIVNNVEKNNTASLNSRTLDIKGFGSTDPQTVRLYSVDRSQNISEPAEVAITPATPPVDLIYSSMEMQEAFGGVLFRWENVAEEDVTLVIEGKTTDGEWEELDVVYSNIPEGSYTLRNQPSEQREFSVTVRDRWDNFSPRKSQVLTPLFEEKLDKKLWSRHLLTGDNSSERASGSGGFWTELYDDNLGLTSYNWWYANVPTFPFFFTIDLGVTAKLSRNTLWHYMMNNGQTFTYGQHFNVKRWKIYGTNTISSETDESYWKAEGEGEGWKGDWYLLADCYSYKPSGMDNNTVTQADRDYSVGGFSFDMDIAVPPVRYVRFHVTETWLNSWEVIIGEITFWGAIQN